MIPDQPPDLTVTRRGGEIELDWTFVTATFDVIHGDLETLLATAGDFTAAVGDCLAEDHPDNRLSLPEAALPRSAFFLVRTSDCVPFSPNGWYSTSSPSQSGWRDTKINASPLSCPD